MSELSYRRLDGEELAVGLASLTDWAVEDGQIAKIFSFKTYKDGLTFAVAVGYIADRLDHHPDLFVGYGKVRVGVSTHSVKGLSPYDLELARRIEALQG